MATVAAVGLIVGLFLSIASIGMTNANQRQLQEDSQTFNSEEAQKARAWALSPEHMEQLDALGINRDVAIASMFGMSGATPSASSGIVNPQNSAGAFAQMMSGLGANVNDALLNPHKASNLDSQTNLNQIDAYWTPLLNSEKIDLWSANADLYKSQGAMYESLGNLYDEQALYVGPLSSAEIQSMNGQYVNFMAQSIKAFEEAKTEENLRSWYDASATAAYASANASNAAARLSNAAAVEQEFVNNNMLELKKQMLQYGVSEEYYDMMDKYYNNVIRQNMPANLPISDDMLQTLWMLKASGNAEFVNVADSTWQSILQGAADQYDAEQKNAVRNFWNSMLLQFTGVVPAAAEGAAEGLSFGVSMRAAGKGGNVPSGLGTPKVPNPHAKGHASRGKAKSPNPYKPNFQSNARPGTPEYEADYKRYLRTNL